MAAQTAFLENVNHQLAILDVVCLHVAAQVADVQQLPDCFERKLLAESLQLLLQFSLSLLRSNLLQHLLTNPDKLVAVVVADVIVLGAFADSRSNSEQTLVDLVDLLQNFFVRDVVIPNLTHYRGGISTQSLHLEIPGDHLLIRMVEGVHESV